MANQATPKLPAEEKMMQPVVLFLLVGILLAYIDKELQLYTFLLEAVHFLVVTAAFIACLVFQRRYPHIRQFGWSCIVWGMAFLMVGSIMDLLDDPPMICLSGKWAIPFGPSWEKAFLKKTLGYTTGFGLFAYGFFRWIPWMSSTRQDIHRLNVRLSHTNRNLNHTLMSLDEHVESARISISRELHDDVAQQLTAVNVQLQLCRKDMESGESPRIQGAGVKLKEVSSHVSEALRSVRQISGDLRPASLYSIGLIPALEQFIEKLQNQNPDVDITLAFLPLDGSATSTRFEKTANDSQLLHLYRIIQESIRNALKHSGANSIHALLQEQSGSPEDGLEGELALSIRIEDNGKGLPWQEMPTDDILISQGHLGLVGLKERVNALSGRFMLANRKDGAGAYLEICVPS